MSDEAPDLRTRVEAFVVDLRSNYELSAAVDRDFVIDVLARALVGDETPGTGEHA